MGDKSCVMRVQGRSNENVEGVVGIVEMVEAKRRPRVSRLGKNGINYDAMRMVVSFRARSFQLLVPLSHGEQTYSA